MKNSQNNIKIGILDIDGVMNSFTFNRDKPAKCFIPEAVECLNFLSDNYDVKIVISSAWRHNKSLDELRKIFTDNGCRSEIIDITPFEEPEYLDIADNTISEIESEDDFYKRIPEDKGRNYEVMKYIKDNNIVQYFILDDMWFTNKELLKHFVKIDNNIGLNLSYLDSIIAVLNL